MIGISKEGCVKLAHYHHREFLLARKYGQICIAFYHRNLRDDWMEEARAK